MERNEEQKPEGSTSRRSFMRRGLAVGGAGAIDRKFPRVSIIRPTETRGAAMGALKSFVDDGLFIGQPPEFFALLTQLAREADAARRES